MDPLLKIVTVRLEVAGKRIIDSLSFQVNCGDIIGIIGNSGAGKTSLFRMINLLQSPTSGKIFYRDQDILSYPPTILRREIGYVFQKPYLFGNSVMENLIYPYQLTKQKPDEAEIDQYLREANLSESIKLKKNYDLSGGEQQRIALIRSLLIKPKVLLLDEVTSSLDEENTLVIEQLIRKQHEQRQMTVLFISHSSQQAERLAEKILFIKNGHLHFYGSKSDYFVGRGC